MPRVANDSQYLERLRDYYASHRSIPSYSRLGEVLGVAAKSAVKKILERLAAQGFLRRTPDDVWVPETRFFERRLSDAAVPAGMPVTPAELPGDTFLIDQYLVKQPSQTLMVPVKGDSMRDAGIHDGDIAVVERHSEAHAGELVIAVVDGEFTLKRLAREGAAYVLQPENPAYPVIRPAGALEIFGVVRGIVRRYGGG